MAIRNSANYKIGQTYNFELGGKTQLVTVLEKRDRKLLLQNPDGMKMWFGWEHITIPQKSKAKIEQKVKTASPKILQSDKLPVLVKRIKYEPKPPIVKVKPVVEELATKISIPKVVIESDNYHYRLATLRKEIRDLLKKHNIENTLNFQSMDKEYIVTLDKNLQKISKSLQILASK